MKQNTASAAQAASLSELVQTDMEAAVETPQARLEKLERERVTRRQALARIGFRAGAAVIAALSVDDIARMARVAGTFGAQQGG